GAEAAGGAGDEDDLLAHGSSRFGGGRKGGRSVGLLSEAAVDVDDLAVDPPGRAREERDGLRDVGRLAEPLKRDGLGEVVDGLLVLAVEEERRGGGTGGDRVDGDVLAAQFAGQDHGHALYGGLGGDVSAVVRELRTGDRGGEVDERAARAQAVGGELGEDEGAADVGAVHAVEVGQVKGRDRRQEHDPGRVDDDVDAAELRLDRVERRRHRDLVGDVASDGDRLAAGRADLRGERLGALRVAGVVDRDGEAVLGEALDDAAADAAGASGDEGDAGAGGAFGGHGDLP